MGFFIKLKENGTIDFILIAIIIVIIIHEWKNLDSNIFYLTVAFFIFLGIVQAYTGVHCIPGFGLTCR